MQEEKILTIKNANQMQIYSQLLKFSIIIFTFSSCSQTPSVSNEIKTKIDSVVISEFEISNPSIADKLLITVDSHPESSYHVSVRVNPLYSDSFKTIYWAYHINKKYEILQAQKHE